jgi:hypothetical protein
MACNGKNGGKISCDIIPQRVPILPTSSRRSNPFPKVQCQIWGGISSEIHFANTVPLQTQQMIQCSWKSCWKALRWLTERPHTPIGGARECHRSTKYTSSKQQLAGTRCFIGDG